MHCDVYKFPRHDDMYVYIARPNYPDDVDEITDWLSVLPKDLRQTFGSAKFVIHLDLDTTPKLARVDKSEVAEKLATQGYYVQLPPPDVFRRQADLRSREAQDKKYD